MATPCSTSQTEQQATRPSGGYPCDVLDNTSGSMETGCSICFKLLRDPQLVTCCKKSFCRTCIEKPTAELYEDRCPQCGTADFTVVPDVRLEAALQNVRVCCRYPHGQDIDEVCEWVGLLSEFDHHLGHNCKFVETPCRNCNVQFQRRHIYSHSAACPKRQSTCEFCGFVATYDVVVRHVEDECRRVTVRCPRNCEEQIERQDLEEHEKICPCAEVDCECTGCEFRPLRKDLQTHLKENVVEHLARLSDLYEGHSQQINDLRQERSGIELSPQELQIAFLEKKQDEHQGRLKQAEGMLRGVDYNVKCRLPQQIMRLQNQCDKLEQTQEELKNSADYQSNNQQIANQKLKEELTEAIDKQQCEMATLQRKQEESTAAQQQLVVEELKQEIEQTNQVMEEKLVKLSDEGKMLMACNKEELSTAIAQGDRAVKDELKTTIAEGDQTVKDELTAKLTSENLALKGRMDAVSKENQELKKELESLNTKFDRKIEELTRDLVRAKHSFQQEMQNMQETQDRKMNRLQNEHHQDLLLLRSSMVSCVKTPFNQRMTNFADRKSSNNPWYSEPFTIQSVGTYKFVLVVFANGSGPHRGTHVSIYAHLMDSGTADPLPFEGEIVVLLMNQLGDRQARHNKSVNVPLSREVPGIERTPGTDLVSHEALNYRTENLAYLHNDQLHLRIVDFKPAPSATAKRGGGWFSWQ